MSGFCFSDEFKNDLPRFFAHFLGSNGFTMESSANDLGISVRTLRRWLINPSTQQLLDVYLYMGFVIGIEINPFERFSPDLFVPMSGRKEIITPTGFTPLSEEG